MCLDPNPKNRVLGVREAGEDQEGMQERENSRSPDSQKASTPDWPAYLYNPSSATSTTTLPNTAAPQLPLLQHCNPSGPGCPEGSRLVDSSCNRIQWQTYQASKGRENDGVRCFNNRLGSQLPGSPDRGPMGSEGSPDAYQLVGVKGSLPSLGNICSKLDERACLTAAGQPNCNCLNKQKGKSALKTTIRSGSSALGVVSGQGYHSKSRTHSGSRECQGRSGVETQTGSQRLKDRFQSISNRWGPLQVDLFAVRHNAQLPRYFSFKPDPGAVAVDAFAQDWSDLTPYAFPPFLMVAVLRYSLSRTHTQAGSFHVKSTQKNPYHHRFERKLVFTQCLLRY